MPSVWQINKYRTVRHFLILVDGFFPWILLKTDAVKLDLLIELECVS